MLRSIKSVRSLSATRCSPKRVFTLVNCRSFSIEPQSQSTKSETPTHTPGSQNPKAIEFRRKHVVQCLEGYSEGTPLDVHSKLYCRDNTSLGSKDRKYVLDCVFGIVKWQSYLDERLINKNLPINFHNRLTQYLEDSENGFPDDETLSAHARASVNPALWEAFERQFGPTESLNILRESNKRAPLTIRINTLKSVPSAFIALWEEKYPMYPLMKAQHATNAYHWKGPPINVYSLPEYTHGLIEIQDEGSQIISSMVKPRLGDVVLDYCAGSGGKVLAIAANVMNSARFYLHDVRDSTLIQAKTRIERAGVDNFSLLFPWDTLKVKQNLSKTDWLLLDVPCTATGTLRRNPHIKWRFSKDWLKEIQETQRNIMHESIPLLGKGGRVVYSTCSVLEDENEKQVEYLIERFKLKRIAKDFRSLPQTNEMDGYYAAVLQKDY